MWERTALSRTYVTDCRVLYCKCCAFIRLFAVENNRKCGRINRGWHVTKVLAKLNWPRGLIFLAQDCSKQIGFYVKKLLINQLVMYRKFTTNIFSLVNAHCKVKMLNICSFQFLCEDCQIFSVLFFRCKWNIFGLGNVGQSISHSKEN